MARPDASAFLRAYEARASSSLNDPSVDLVQALTGFDDGVEVASGISVSPDAALRYIAVYAAVRYLGESVGSLPFPLYRREGRSRIRISETEDFRAYLLDEEPNPYVGAMTFWETIVGHANLWGNAYVYIERDRAKKPLALWWLDPRVTAPYRTDDGKLHFGTSTSSGSVSLEPRDVIHVRAFGTGDVGISPIGVARQAIGEQLAAEEYAGRFWSNDGRPGGVIQYQRRLDDDQHREAVRRWNAMHQGVKRSHLVAVLDNGATWQDVGLTNGDAQFLETRKWGVRQTASLFRVPPHKIGDLEGNVTFASIDAQNLDAVQDSLRPWCVRIEQAVKRRLFRPFIDPARGELTPDGERRIYPEFLIDALLRGDYKTRMEGYGLGRQWGFLSVNDIREMENQPGIGEVGDIYLQPVNMVPAGTSPESLAQAAAGARAFLASIEAQKVDEPRA